jgi:hypothetical protein
MKIKYMKLTKNILSDSLHYEAFTEENRVLETKKRILEKLNITIKDNESPLQAWLRDIAETNGYRHTIPCHPDITSTIYSSTDLTNFLWFIS